ncbi:MULTISPECIES: hypothetical protein [Pseudonocardia]|uniref:Uncharacterized protein n=1 Tax=Pseudonocardia alni TaxID=33907 RepID=A0A852W8C0_PSEA5|nr:MULTISPECIES: hypothetical protein [Pseudonocardia]MCO7193152.1 hypothetical protein [Pseudonocardia sp. McavD-2-B]NYG05437.1 hypothetical protein [Pseudonocardia antarctica]
MSSTEEAYDRQLGTTPARADEYDRRMVELGMAESDQHRPGLDRFYGYGARHVYTENAVRYLGEMPDGSFETPHVAHEAWAVDEARKDLRIATGELEQEQAAEADGSLVRHNPDDDWSKERAAIDAAREALAAAEQRLAAAERGELTPATPDLAEPDWTTKVHPASLAAYHAAVGHLEYERDGGAPQLYEELVEDWEAQLNREIAEHDGIELEEEPGLEP